ncbi:Gfo/Idh/MocA family oxidoreductase [Pseudochrobactrum algeriensis]|uniref:Gfo/Idh/MocA family protein n=1 Tax=Pseudochrobactrum algeriensis TaxID=2834768 RepID=UPI001BCE08AE|nr:Gfo/Idh/MocA family oxidoreductase [Pseudochrobactrum algeriensis]MBX8813906.1 Gfo/Idh/MocA family oxidoreductase [Ochrobactrum sp. MR34]QVQ36827.1 Gfo/Idh/MocA family oxidoreductase [Pseudochrobactrum algeriensis]QVQ40043.1 Gfo/Idh/MocA family oxidoreductase [Pseudochrobactrum algeriensis]QVQ43966.1 Gfo/Idh/MocA family oxidoreductase [Pseudochrobactrum algeriensis]
MFRWGILSTANIGITQVLPAIAASETGVVQGIASRDAARARAVADRFNAPLSFGSYEELLASDQIDGVYIPLPTSQHIEWSLKAAEAGKHVLCEKPIALKAEEIDRLITARDRHQVVISEAFMVYYHPQWAKVRELIASGQIGRLRMVQGCFTYFNNDPANMRNQVALGGGALPDIGVYPTVVTRIVTGQEPQEIFARIERDPDFGTDRYATVLARFVDFDLSFYVATQLSGRQQMVFHGDQGMITVHAPFNAGKYDHARVTWHDGSHTASQEWTFSNINQYSLQADAFVRFARGEKEVLFSLENSKANQHVIDRIYAAAEKQ